MVHLREVRSVGNDLLRGAGTGRQVQVGKRKEFEKIADGGNGCGENGSFKFHVNDLELINISWHLNQNHSDFIFSRNFLVIG